MNSNYVNLKDIDNYFNKNDASTLWDLFKRTVDTMPDQKFLGTRESDEGYSWTTVKEAAMMVDYFTAGMIDINSSHSIERSRKGLSDDFIICPKQ